MTDIKQVTPDMPTVPEVEVDDLATRFRLADGWMVLFLIVAERVKKMWTTAELSLDFLTQAFNDLKRAVSAPDSLKEKWVATYRMALEIAARDFRGMVKEAYQTRDANAVLRADAETKHAELLEHAGQELAQLKSRKEAAQAALDLELIGLGGDKGAQIHTPKKLSKNQQFVKWGLNLAVVIMTIVVEIIIGRGAIESQTSRLTSQITVAALALFTLFVIHLFMDDFRGFLANWGAKMRFKKQDREHLPAGAQPFPFPMSKAFTAVAGVLFLVSVTVGLLGYRIWVAMNSQTGLASETAGDIIAPFVLVIIIYASAFVIFRQAHDYTSEQYEKVDVLRQQFEDAKRAFEEKEAEVNALRQPRMFEPVDTFHEDVAAAKEYYINYMDNAEQEIKAEVQRLEDQRMGLFGAIDKYRAMFDLYADEAASGMNRLMEKVRQVEKQKPADKRIKLPSLEPDERKRARELFREITSLRFYSDENKAFLETLVRQTFYAVYPANERISDFEAEIAKVEAELNPPEPEPVEDEDPGVGTI